MSHLRTLPEALDEASTSGAGYTFLTEAGARLWSYADLRAAAYRMAAALLAAGLTRGDVVALVLADAQEFLTTLFGATIAGLIPASLYPPFTMSDLPQFFETTTAALMASTARAVITSEPLAAGFEALGAAHGGPDLVLTRATLVGDAALDGWRPSLDDVALVQFTSGSTSSPKGVVLTHRSLAANIDAIRGPAGLDITRADSGVSWLPLYHDMGLVGMSLCALYTSNPAVLMTPEMFVKRPVEWLRAITRYRATVSFAPNFAYELCVRRVKERDLAQLDLSSWRVAGCGAEPVHTATLNAFAEKFAPAGFRSTSFLPSYGLAEHVLAATLPPRERAPLVHVVSAERLAGERIAVPAVADEESSVRLVSCGRPLPGHALRIVREDGKNGRDGEVGEIALAGPSVMLGYYKDDTLTAQTIRDGWLYTGDLGYLSDGELFVCGRSKDLIIVNGRKYHPQDLEWGVEGVAGLRRGRVVAFGTAHAAGGDRVIVVAEPSGTVPADIVAASVRQRIGDLFGLTVGDVALVPSGTIGRTTSGKIQRAAVRTRYERGDLTGVARPEGLHA
jgi:acyl-CoA synthetase (AMP-forming)/AMP-acid ligase II